MCTKQVFQRHDDELSSVKIIATSLHQTLDSQCQYWNNVYVK